MKDRIAEELKHHVPFTAFGALTGILLMFLFRNIPHEAAHKIFYVFHPLHIVLSAIATTSMFKHYQCTHKGFACSIWALILVGYIGSIGIATLSDSLIPFVGENLLKLPHPEAHIGFIEAWWLVNPAALLGIAIAYYIPKTRVPHTGHVLLSTWASLFHMLMALGGSVSPKIYFGIFAFLFISVWLPCCISDIVFPLLVVRTSK
jgi:hypothetical protein